MDTKGFHVTVRIEFGSGTAILGNHNWITSVQPEVGELAGGVEAFVNPEVLILVDPPWSVRGVFPFSPPFAQ
jgi:hypothetical protein